MDDLVKEFKGRPGTRRRWTPPGRLQAEFDHEERSLLSSRGEEADRLQALNPQRDASWGAVLALGAAWKPGLVWVTRALMSTGR